MAADVRSIDALRDWYAALAGYGEMLAEALAGVEMELRRAREWLDDQRRAWQQAVRDCEEEVTRAKEGLRNQVADLAVARAARILRREVDPKVHADLLASLRAEM